MDDIILYLVVELDGLDEAQAQDGLLEVPTICFDDGVIQVESENDVAIDNGTLFVRHRPLMTIFTYTEDMESGEEQAYMAPTKEEIAAIRDKLSSTKLTAAIVSATDKPARAIEAAKVKTATVFVKAEGFEDLEITSDDFRFEVNW